MDLKIVGWTNYDSSFPSVEVANEDTNKILIIVAREIMEKGYVFSGAEHQNSDTGVPVFDNGACFRASMRVWGTIMAAAYPMVNEAETNYMDFYVSTPTDKVMPENECVDIKPMASDFFEPMINQQDSEILRECLLSGIPFMTTDKALKHLYDSIQEQIKGLNNEDN